MTKKYNFRENGPPELGPKVPSKHAAHLEVRTPEEAIAAAERVVGAPTSEEQAQRLASVGSWEHWNRVWTLLGYEEVPALPDFSHLTASTAGAKRKRGYDDEPETSRARLEVPATEASTPEEAAASDPQTVAEPTSAPAAKEVAKASIATASGAKADASASQQKDWGALVDPSTFEEISDEEEDAGARPTAAKPVEDDADARSTPTKPAEASGSSSSSSESDSSSFEEDGGSGRGEGDTQSDEDVEVVELSPPMPKPAQAVAAEEIVRPFRPKGAMTEAAINSFREGCAAAEAGNLVAQLSRSNPMELFINANEALIQAFALNAATSTSADRRMMHLAEEKEALRREVSVEAEKRRRAEASADAARGKAETARAEAEVAKAEAGKAKETLAS
ncbi:hypothetical protein GUJ93_ZPchr0005g14925 [Zizania palustris]|uniref:Uncharacterized protein n=1 Tax=Zizania palustris TaxID=103762 RepID=A0A8J5T5B5_ZIZPA|nr:hypothetical protein GUJ93_ZPchr0005g14925 [Zizania palustris]